MVAMAVDLQSLVLILLAVRDQRASGKPPAASRAPARDFMKSFPSLS
jgi:hypothetical protein